MRNYEELSYEEISKITGITEGGLKANYFHALRKVLELTNEKK
jgi:RNA polymerase sigma-70 factor (ECF subfamily)